MAQHFPHAAEAARARRHARPLIGALVVAGLANAALLVALADLTGEDVRTHAVVGRFVGWFAVYVLTMLVAGVLWLRWFVAVYGAAWVTGHARHPRYWAWAAWLIPVANLFMPYLLVREVWRAAGDGLRLPWFVPVWWGLWLCMLSTDGGPVVRLLPGTDRLWGVVALVAGALAVPFAVTVVRALTARIQLDLPVAVPQPPSFQVPGHSAGV